MVDVFVNLEVWLTDRFERFVERGATSIEYSLMVGILAVSILIGATQFSNVVTKNFNTISNTIPTGAG